MSIIKWFISAAVQIPVWIAGLYWSIYFIPNMLFGTDIHPGHDPITTYAGSVVVILLMYCVVLFAYGFMAHSFRLPKPFFKDNEY